MFKYFCEPACAILSSDVHRFNISLCVPSTPENSIRTVNVGIIMVNFREQSSRVQSFFVGSNESRESRGKQFGESNVSQNYEITAKPINYSRETREMARVASVLSLCRGW